MVGWWLLMKDEIISHTSFRITKKLHQRLKLQSLKEESPQSDIMNQAIEEYLNKYEKQENRLNW